MFKIIHKLLLLLGTQSTQKNCEVNKDLRGKKYKPMVEVDKDWILRGEKSKNGKRIIIDKFSKKGIITELKRLGVSGITLYPEIDKVAKYIKENLDKT